jgi:hypothetical protein
MYQMSTLAWRMSLAGVAVAALAALSACNESPPSAPPPPPAAAYQPAPPPPALLGAPPPHQFTAMAPIPKPEDMTPAERARVYGARYRAHHHGDHSPGWWLRAHGYGAGRAASHTAPAPQPVVAAKIAAAPKPAPVLTQAPSPLTQLAAAVADKSKGAMLSAPSDLSAKKPGAVTLSLPADLLTVIRQEAAKLGLGRAAKKTEVTATLHGDGYTVTPPGPQTAPLVAGKPATFTWQVAPGPNAKGPLTADVNALLKGAGDAQSFSLAKLKQAVAAVDAAVKAAGASHGFKFPSLDMLSIPGHKDLTLPVVGKTPSKSIVGALIVLAILLLLAMLARGSTGRRVSPATRRHYGALPSATPAVGLTEPEPHVEHVLAPAVEHAHAVEHAAAHAHEADHPVPEPAAAVHYEEPHMAADHHAEAVVERHAEVHPAEDHPVAEPVVEHHPVAAEGDYMLIGDLGHAADHHTVEHAADGHADAHGTEAHGADAHTAETHAEEPHAEPHAAVEPAADERHAADDHHHAPVEHRQLELESL